MESRSIGTHHTSKQLYFGLVGLGITLIKAPHFSSAGILLCFSASTDAIHTLKWVHNVYIDQMGVTIVPVEGTFHDQKTFLKR